LISVTVVPSDAPANGASRTLTVDKSLPDMKSVMRNQGLIILSMDGHRSNKAVNKFLRSMSCAFV